MAKEKTPEVGMSNGGHHMNMPGPRDVTNWVETYLRPRYPELVDEHQAAVKAYNAAVRTGSLDTRALTTLVDLAQHRSSILRGQGAEMIGRLSNAFPSARVAIADLLASRRANARDSALMALRFHQLSPLYAELLPEALCDKSHRIRGVAAEIVLTRGLVELMPLLEQTLSQDPHDGTREFLRQCLSFMKDGYVIDSDDGATMWVTARTSYGQTSSSFQVGEDWATRGQTWLARSAKPADTLLPRGYPV